MEAFVCILCGDVSDLDVEARGERRRYLLMQMRNAQISHTKTRSVCAGTCHIHALEIKGQRNTSRETIINTRADKDIFRVLDDVSKTSGSRSMRIVCGRCSDADCRCGF